METLDNQVVIEAQPTEQTTGVVDETQNQVTETQTPKERTFTRNDIDGIMSRRLQKTYNAFHELLQAPQEFRTDRTTFANWLKTEWDEGKKARDLVNQLQGQIGDLQGQLFNATKELSFIHNGVDPNKYDDILTYFKGKGVNFTEELLKQELATHQDWLIKQEPKAIIQSLGLPKQTIDSNKHNEMMAKVFGK